MSSSSGLAAARRRRGGVEPEQMQNYRHLQQKIPPPPEFSQKPNLNPLEILREHDKKLFYLERFFDEHHSQLENIKHSDESRKKVDNISNGSNTMIKNVIDELMVVKTNVFKLSKNLEETTSTMTILRASLLHQANEINNLKEIILVKANFTNLINNKDTNTHSESSGVSIEQALDVISNSEEKTIPLQVDPVIKSEVKVEPKPIIKQEINPKQILEESDSNSESDDSDDDNSGDKSLKEDDDIVEDISMKKRGRPKKELVSIDNLNNYTLNSTKTGEIIESVNNEPIHATILRNNRKQSGKGKKKNNISLELNN
jgi:hypothetical protein